MKAVIFDMDGVLVDSEPFWSQAEQEVFTSLGVPLTEELCQQTSRMTTSEVAAFWYARAPWSDDVSMFRAERRVIDRVKSLIITSDCIISGVNNLIQDLKSSGLKLGLATNAPEEIIPVVLSKAGLEDSFDAICSSENEDRGKPAPDVYLSVLKQLNVTTSDALAIEDSDSGIKAARQAGMKVAAFTNGGRNRFIEYVDALVTDFSQPDLRQFIFA